MKPDRPTILIIQADQLAARYLGAYGFAIASTPHVDPLEQTNQIDNPGNREVRERHSLRADKVYSQWAYHNILDYRFPEE